jgi:hypothetical protein
VSCTQPTGRTVKAFMSGVDVEQDIACEVFVLEPESRSARG